MKQFQIDPNISIRCLEDSDTDCVHSLITNNRTHLDTWLRWSSSIQTVEDVRSFIELFQQKMEEKSGFHFGIWYEDKLAGGIVCWFINRDNQNAEIGYWLGQDYTGLGLVSRTIRTVIDFLFEEEKLNRIKMQCGVENIKSPAIPERLGFQLEGIRRQSHWITNRYVDHAIYSMLSDEWSSY